MRDRQCFLRCARLTGNSGRQSLIFDGAVSQRPAERVVVAAPFSIEQPEGCVQDNPAVSVAGDRGPGLDQALLAASFKLGFQGTKFVLIAVVRTQWGNAVGQDDVVV